MEDTLNGSIEHIVFTSEETGFTVANLKIPNESSMISIVGIMPTVLEGEDIFCKGTWKYHAKHGKQFEVESYEQQKPQNLKGIEKYLESGFIKGIGPTYAKRIVEKFGLSTLNVIDETPKKLLEIEGIGQKRVDLIIKHWNGQKSIRDVMIFLQSHQVRPSLSKKIYKVYGDQSIEKVKENPYALAKSIFGVGFKTADAIAANLGIPKDSATRINAAIEFCLWELSSEGHVCYPEDDLIKKVQEMLEIDLSKVSPQIQELESLQKIIRKKLEDNLYYIWVRPLYLCEVGIARELSRIQDGPCSIREIKIDKAADWVEEQMRFKLASQQKEALKTSLEAKLHIITGGPGTGKSTITKGIIRILEKVTNKILLGAPTGRAAKRLSEITRKKAFTIHSLLEMDFQGGGFKRNHDNPLKCDLLIIDEASMIDTQLMYSLLKAIPDKARLIFVGDIDQLPSVGPGNVLKDMIDSEKIVTSSLTKIFRQAAGSKIITNAHSVNKGYFPDLSNPPESDFIYISADDVEEIAGKVLYLVKEELPKSCDLDPFEDIQVLCPMKKGGAGIENLNHIMQNSLNPAKESLQKMGRTFRVGDKVMQIKNNYDKKVFNGDVGRIQSINLTDQEICVIFDQLEIVYDFSEIDELVLAYAVSIHKYQGSECKCVILPIHTSHFKLLYRNLIYTGITRGKKLVILIGSKKAIAIAVKNDQIKKRYSGLKLFITST